MILQSFKFNRFTFLLGAFLAFVIIAAPHAAKAQALDVCDANGDYYTSSAHTLGQVASRIIQVRKEHLDNSRVIHSDDYCISNLIKIIEDLKIAVAGADAYHLLLTITLNTVLSELIGFACQISQAIFQDITQIGNSILGPLKICLPFPQLHFGLNYVHAPNACTGSIEIGLQPMKTPPQAPPQTDVWPIWSNQNSQFPISNTKGP